MAMRTREARHEQRPFRILARQRGAASRPCRRRPQRRRNGRATGLSAATPSSASAGGSGIALNGRGRPRSRKSPAAKPATVPGRKQHKRAGRRGPKKSKDVRACANPAAGRGPVRSQECEGPVPFMSIGPGLCRFPLWGSGSHPDRGKAVLRRAGGAGHVLVRSVRRAGAGDPRPGAARDQEVRRMSRRHPSRPTRVGPTSFTSPAPRHHVPPAAPQAPAHLPRTRRAGAVLRRARAAFTGLLWRMNGHWTGDGLAVATLIVLAWLGWLFAWAFEGMGR